LSIIEYKIQFFISNVLIIYYVQRNTTFTSKTFILSVPRYNSSVTSASTSTINPFNYANEYNRITFNETIRDAVRSMRFQFNFPVYYVDLLSYPGIGYLQNDAIHPNAQGHAYIKDRVNEVLATGERVLWN